MYVLLEERKGGERHLIQKESIYSKNVCFPARGSHEYNDKSKFHALFSVRNRLEKARESLIYQKIVHIQVLIIFLSLLSSRKQPFFNPLKIAV